MSSTIYSTIVSNGMSHGSTHNFKSIQVGSTGYDALVLDQDLTSCTVNIDYIYGNARAGLLLKTAKLNNTQINIKSLNVSASSSGTVITALHYGTTA